MMLCICNDLYFEDMLLSFLGKEECWKMFFNMFYHTSLIQFSLNTYLSLVVEEASDFFNVWTNFDV